MAQQDTDRPLQLSVFGALTLRHRSPKNGRRPGYCLIWQLGNLPAMTIAYCRRACARSNQIVSK